MTNATTEVVTASEPTDVDEPEFEGDHEAPREAVDEGLPLDQVYEVLRNQRRRYVLSFLEEVDDSISMGELSERIAALENDKEVGDITSSERKRVYVGLYQCHLPKMDGMDVIDFNKPRGIVKPGPNAHLFKPYLDSEPADRTDWHLYYAGLAVAGAIAVAAAIAVRPMTDLPVVDTVVVLTLLAFLGVSAFNAWAVSAETNED